MPMLILFGCSPCGLDVKGDTLLWDNGEATLTVLDDNGVERSVEIVAPQLREYPTGLWQFEGTARGILGGCEQESQASIAWDDGETLATVGFSDGLLGRADVIVSNFNGIGTTERFTPNLDETECEEYARPMSFEWEFANPPESEPFEPYCQ